MHNTLLVDNTSVEIERLYSLSLFTWVNSRLESKQSIEKALEFIEISKPKMDLIIFRYTKENDADLAEFKTGLRQLDSEVPLIIVGKEDVDTDDTYYLESILNIKDIVRLAAIKLNTTAASMAQLKVPDYFPIPVEFFTYITSPTIDIYKRVDEEFELYYSSDDEYTQESLEYFLIDYDCPFLYVEKDHRLRFVNYLSQEIVSQISFRVLSQNEKVTAVEMTQFLLAHKLKKFGIGPQTMDLAKRNMAFMLRDAKSSRGISGLLKKLLSNKTGFLYQHSQVLSYVCLHIMEHIDWGNDDQKKAITFVAYFHDILLESDEQARIHSEAELENSNLTEAEKKIVMSHAQKAGEVVQRYPKAPMGADVIIRQHHGIAHGIGFSQYFSGNLSPMAVVFIIAEDFTSEIVNESPALNIAAKIKKMREKYPSQRFKRIIDILETIPI